MSGHTRCWVIDFESGLAHEVPDTEHARVLIRELESDPSIMPLLTWEPCIIERGIMLRMRGRRMTKFNLMLESSR